MTSPGSGRHLAEQIATRVGGPDNIADVDHCVTRLRLVLRDPARADKAAIGSLPGVLSVVDRAGQLQVIIGDEVAVVHGAVLELKGGGAGAAAAAGPTTATAPRRRFADRAFDLLTGTFQPLLPALVGSGLVKTFLLVAVELGWVDTTSASYAVWAAAGNAAFYFLPVLVGITASRKLGANPYVGGVIGAALLESNFTGLGPVGTEASFLGLRLVVIDYGQSVIPPIIAAILLSVMERTLKRRLPKSLHLVAVPALCLAVIVPATLVAFGPLGTYAGEAVSDAIGWVWDLSPAVAGALMGGFWQVFVIFGLHWGFVPVIVNDLSVQGYSLLTGPLVAAVLAQGAATLAVLVRTRNRSLRELAGAASISAFVAGVTEPAIYGVTLRLRRPFVFACVGGAVGGAIAAAGGSAADSFILPGLITLPAYLNVGSFTLQLVGTAVAVLVAFGLTVAVGFDDVPEPGAGADGPREPRPDAGSAPDGNPADRRRPAERDGVDASGPAHDDIGSPTPGRVVPLSAVADPVFAGGVLGPGVAVVPSDGVIRSPVEGTVASLARSAHAVGVTSEHGVDVLVHVGIDTVHVAAQHCRALVATGQHVRRGDPLIQADLDALTRAGCDTTTPVVVTNAAAFPSVELVAQGDVSDGDPLIRVHRR